VGRWNIPPNSRRLGRTSLTLTTDSYNTDETVNSIGRPVPSPYNPVGPCITGVIDCREISDNPLDGFVIEEGTVPHALAHLLQFMLDHMPGSITPKSEKDNVVERTRAAFARYGSRFLGPYYKNGAIAKTQTYLIMSHDSKCRAAINTSAEQS